MRNAFQTTLVEMSCIGDHADYVVYQRYSTNVREASGPSDCSWMVPGSELGRDEFGRKVEQ